MTDVATSDDPERWVIQAARAADAMTDEETIVLDVGDVLSITGWFVITGGRNERQVKAVAGEIEEKIMAQGGPKPVRTEGLDSLSWVLLDYGSFVAHVFTAEARQYYDLERLWSDVPRTDWKIPVS
jgi:ribosome-associated protein